MSAREAKIGAKLREAMGQFGPEYLQDGEVAAVDSEAYTCDVVLESDGSTQFNCRLRATATGDKSIDVLPAVGSSVVIAKMGAEEYLVLAIDEITSYRVTVGGMVLTITEAGFGISNGGDSVKSILTDLVNAILTIAAPKNVAGITALLERIAALFQ
jgi:hypothetical protein